MVSESRLQTLNTQAQRVLLLAEEEAREFNHNYVGTGHILLGLVRETEGTASRFLSSLGIDQSRVRSFIVGQDEKHAQGEIGLTPAAKKVVELAVDRAHQMNHPCTGTWHLLIGLIEGIGLATGILKILGVTLDKVQVATHRILIEPEKS